MSKGSGVVGRGRRGTSTMGAGGSRFTVRQRMELDACTRCGECLKACETYGRTGTDATAPAEKLKQFRGILMGEGRGLFLSRLFRRERGQAEMQEFAKGVYSCTLCSRCTEVCPAKIDLLGLWFSMRQDLADRDVHPQNLNTARDAIAATHNVVNYPNEERATWVEFMMEAPEHLYQRERAEVLYFVGCMSSFSPAIQGIPQAYAQVLEKAGVDFTILGEREWCCGFPLKAAGMRDRAEELIVHNIEMVRAVGARIVTFNCPSCYNTWLKEYGPRLPDVDLLHSSQFLARLVKEGRLKPEAMDLAVAYHDPCDLGRNSGVYRAPREVIGAVPGLRLREPPAVRERAHCCGGGGDLEIVDAGLAGDVSVASYQALLKNGAEAIVTACPQCTRMFRASAQKSPNKVEVIDLTELILKSLE